MCVCVCEGLGFVFGGGVDGKAWHPCCPERAVEMVMAGKAADRRWQVCVCVWGGGGWGGGCGMD